MNDRDEMVWSPRVKLREIKALYVNCASGIYDEALIDSVGIALYLRCDSVLEYTWATEGKVRCKRCYKDGVELFILRESKVPREVLRCPVCGWQIQWRVYVSETKKRSSGQLTAGRARRAFEEYRAKYPVCKDPGKKMIAIDQLIHEFHWTLKNDLSAPSADRSACVNLLDGSATEIMETLNHLTYGENTDVEIMKTKEWWSSQRAAKRQQ